MNIETAVISLSEKSISAAYELSKIFNCCDLYIMEKHRQKEITDIVKSDNKQIKFYDNINILVENIFKKYKVIIFIMATGIAIRSIAKFVHDKAEDPAIIVCDEKLNFAISILSGHIGGANNICRYIAENTGATAVITTSTDVNNVSALDNIALSLNAFRNDDRNIYKKINYMLANGDKVHLISDIKLPEDLDLRGFTLINKDDLKNMEKETIVYIGYRNCHDFDDKNNFFKVIPRCIFLGIGCKKNIDYALLKITVEEYLQDNNIDIKSVYKIASIDIKKYEQALIKLSEELGVEFITMNASEIIESKYYTDIKVNNFVRGITGVDSVSLACAKILSKNNIIAYNLRKNGITISAGLRKEVSNGEIKNTGNNSSGRKR